MTIPLAERRRTARRRRAFAYWGVCAAMYLSLLFGAALSPPDAVHYVALFVHLASVVVGLGAAVLLEVLGLWWAAGRGALADVLRLEHLVTPVAWLGIVGLLVSGAFLSPDLSQPLTLVKMAAVLLVALNGVAMTRLTGELSRLPGQVRFAALPGQVKLWCIWSATVSQIGWWTAVIVGMVNTTTP